MERLSGWRRHFPAYRPSTSSSSMEQGISLTAPGIHSVYRLRCIARGGFIPAASNPLNRSIWRLVWNVRRPAIGFSIALFLPPGGGTTLFSRETTCFSSGRKNEFASGAPPMTIPCDRSSRWTSYGRSRQPGIRRAYKKTRGGRNPMRCVPSSPGLAWEATFGIRSRIVSARRSNPDLKFKLLIGRRVSTLT
jgi:hypothetical protein